MTKSTTLLRVLSESSSENVYWSVDVVSAAKTQTISTDHTK